MVWWRNRSIKIAKAPAKFGRLAEALHKSKGLNKITMSFSLSALNSYSIILPRSSFSTILIKKS